MTIQTRRSILDMAIPLIAIGFGILTIKAGGTVLFGDNTARLAAGDYVPFVLWFNFLAGFAYVITGVGLWMQAPWSPWLSIAITLSTLLVFIAFGVHVLSGGSFEQRTVFAMSLRSVIWIAITVFAWFRRPKWGRQC